MTTRRLPRLGVSADLLAPHLDQIRERTGIPTSFPPDALAQAEAAAEQWTRLAATIEHHDVDWASHVARTADPVTVVRDLPTATIGIDPASLDALWAEAVPTLDATCIPLVTIDPASSTDLDQALAITPLPDGSRGRLLVIYAIASVATFVRPDSPLDHAVRERGTTVYMPDEASPLHPRCLSSGAASLLPGQVCPAYVWAIVLDEEGATLASRVDRALVRSRAKLSYDDVNAALGTTPATGDDTANTTQSGSTTPLPQDAPADLPDLLRAVGEARLRREAARGGVSLEVPEQEIERDGDTYTLSYRATTPAEEWNAQISLMTGICAARHMRGANMGIMRTLPPADPRDLERLRKVAKALSVDWPADMSYPGLIRSLDSSKPTHEAFMLEATSLFRGAGYRAFGVRNTEPLPHSYADGIIHAAIASEYAHVTAPLRRLVDRFGQEVCVAQCRSERPPSWVVDSLDDLPDIMASTTQRASKATREALRVVEALLMVGREGDHFTGTVVETRDHSAVVMLTEPAVRTTCEPPLPLGTSGTFTPVSASLDDRRIVVRPDSPQP